MLLACLASLLSLFALWTKSRDPKNSEISKHTNIVSNLPGPQGIDAKLLFDSNRSGTFGIYIFNLATRKITPLYDSNLHDLCPRQSPNGEWIAFIRSDNLDKYGQQSCGACAGMAVRQSW